VSRAETDVRRIDDEPYPGKVDPQHVDCVIVCSVVHYKDLELRAEG
jgi:hypothetical protein